MAFRVGGCGDAAGLVTAANQTDKILGVAVLRARRRVFRLVAPQGQDILNAVGGKVVQNRLTLSGRCADAGKMSQSGDAVVVLDMSGYFQRASVGGAASAIGDADKVWLDLLQLFDALENGFQRRIRLGRENLKRNNWFFLLKQFVYQHRKVLSVLEWYGVLRGTRYTE